MTCHKCGEETDELFSVRVGSRRRKYCEECYEVHQQEEEIAAEAEGVVRGMMEYKG